MSTPPQQVLVLGATGKTGGRVVRQLAQQGIAVRAACRNPDRVAVADGVTPVHFDWDAPATHGPALAGADAVYVVPPALVLDHVAPVTAFFGTVREAGVPRAVFLSARGVDASDDIPLRREELALEASGLRWSVVRPSWFAQNFTEGSFAEMVRAGVLALPAGEGAEPFIDAEDIAAVAARLLVDPALDGRAYDLSGPEALTFEQAAKTLGTALGRELRYVDVDSRQWQEQAVAGGLPAQYAQFLAAMLEGIGKGWDAHLSDGVPTVLGRPARSFAQWAATLERA